MNSLRNLQVLNLSVNVLFIKELVEKKREKDKKTETNEVLLIEAFCEKKNCRRIPM